MNDIEFKSPWRDFRLIRVVNIEPDDSPPAGGEFENLLFFAPGRFRSSRSLVTERLLSLLATSPVTSPR